MKEINVGDTVLDINSDSLPLGGYEEIKPNIYSNFYPNEPSQYKELKKALEELQIQDSSLTLESINSPLLGPGFLCGFLGLLHREIISERIKREYNCENISTAPSITYRITDKKENKIEIKEPHRISKIEKIKLIEELLVITNITFPEEYLGDIIQLCQSKRGVYHSEDWKIDSFYQLKYYLPFAEVINDFQDKLKSISQGYASFDYEIVGFRSSDIVKIDILLNGQLVPDLSFFVHRQFAYSRAKIICENLKQNLSPQSFSIPIQACIGNQVIARETLPALRKDVTGYLYGGDRTRKMKL